MMMAKRFLILAILTGGMIGCVYQSSVMFPDADEIFITSGDGDIQKPYTPVGEFVYAAVGYRIPFPLLGLVDLGMDVDPDMVLRQEVNRKVREMGGDALINMRITWTPPTTGFLGFNAKGGDVVVTGTVIRR